MTILELANRLKAIYDKHGDVPVVFAGPNMDQDPYGVEVVNFQKVQYEDEYLEEFDMPKGFEFVMLGN